MNQNIFETRQRAAELLQEAVRIWQGSDKSEYLEDLSADPVFKLLLNALAYMSNELESDIDSLKEEIFEEFEGMMSRGEGVKATPAMTVITAPLIAGVSDVNINSSDEFYISGDNGNRFIFTPLFRTRAINASVQKVIRLDARRWGVTLSFPETVNNLSGFAFSVPFYRFQGLELAGPDNFPVLIQDHFLVSIRQDIDSDSASYGIGNCITVFQAQFPGKGEVNAFLLHERCSLQLAVAEFITEPVIAGICPPDNFQ